MRYRTLSKPLQTLHLSDFDFTLPPELIARAPLAERSASRLLAVVGGAAPDRSVALHDRHFRDLPSLLAPGDLLIANDSRVLHARLRGHKDTGGRVDMLIERLLGDFEALAQIRATHAPRPGSRLLLSGGISAEVLERRDMFYRMRFAGDRPVDRLLAEHGEVPLPPYLGRAAEADDAERYQTVFARAPGSVAAPTAGLHFDPPLLAELTRRGVALAPLTLHVGAGTFQPVRSEDLAAHHMHREWYRIPEATVRAIEATRQRRGRIVAIGTTTLRALESAALAGSLAAGERETDLFILPGFRFRIVDALVTNFHLPRSTLLMLVAAFAGMAPMRAAYAHAIASGYRFYSYGDAMLLERCRT
ncbi:MAG TPA: tRNA preQ1(34) S-adenosylmethionine ribosyltransferase-isomerase QueA [Rhodocyclaceae bacterium]|nr:tRNA preQ1(34) S-adenosylmethionine ribosyltransferase-isomerase QueA [Rhodocyclaceae bacterium]